ncbi:MAG: hypothetical protein QNI84_00015 [Henriciella sp.]|nr:hypothetical protein [Henriciella sp.]
MAEKHEPSDGVTKTQDFGFELRNRFWDHPASLFMTAFGMKQQFRHVSY